MKHQKIKQIGLSILFSLTVCGCSLSLPSENETVEQTPVVEDGSYSILTVDGGDLSGERKPNVKVDIGYGDREYWAYTNEYGQLVKVTAEEIILQDDRTESVISDGRYYRDEAKVPGVEQPDLDEGHVIADSLGGVSNAYNITPQNSTLNRHGDQAYMENVIRDAGGCTNFTAIITYPDTETQIPSHYDYTYTIYGEEIHESFDNQNPEKSPIERMGEFSPKTKRETDSTYLIEQLMETLWNHVKTSNFSES